jgi:hypothetical protein
MIVFYFYFKSSQIFKKFKLNQSIFCEPIKPDQFCQFSQKPTDFHW